MPALTQTATVLPQAWPQAPAAAAPAPTPVALPAPARAPARTLPTLTRTATGVTPSPATNAQIEQRATDYAQKQIKPLLEQLTSSIEGRSERGTAAIKGYSDALAAQLKKQAASVSQPYKDAQVSQADTDAALAQRLTGAGTNLSDELAKKLALAGTPGGGSAGVPGQVAQTGKGAGNAIAALGSAELSKLIALGANASSYANKLPGIAGLKGLQSASDLQAQLATALSTGRTSILGKAPGIASSALSSMLTSRDKLATSAAADERARLGRVASSERLAEAAKAKAEAALARNNGIDVARSKFLGYLVHPDSTPIYGKNGKLQEIPDTAAGKPNAVWTRLMNDGNIYDANLNVIRKGAPITTKDSTADFPVGASVSVTKAMKAAGYPGLWGGTPSKPRPVIGPDGKQMQVPKNFFSSDEAPSAGSAIKQLDSFFKDAAALNDLGDPTLSRKEATRRALILMDGIMPNATPAQKAALVNARVDKWYPAAPAAPAVKPDASAKLTYKSGKTGIFVYDDPGEAVGNNTPGVKPIRRIAMGDPEFAAAVELALDPVTMKPLNPHQKRELLKAAGVGPKAPGP